jgi:hypothetical protein
MLDRYAHWSLNGSKVAGSRKTSRAGGVCRSMVLRSGCRLHGPYGRPGMGTIGHNCSGAYCRAVERPRRASWSPCPAQLRPKWPERRRSTRGRRGLTVKPPVPQGFIVSAPPSYTPGHRALLLLCRSRRPPTSTCRYRLADISQCGYRRVDECLRPRGSTAGREPLARFMPLRQYPLISGTQPDRPSRRFSQRSA